MLGVTIAVVALGCGIWATLRREGLTLLNPRNGYEVVPASTLTGQPWIDFKLPWGGQLMVPKKSTTRFPINHKTMSGLLRFTNKRSGGGTALTSFDWTVEGERYHFEGPSDMTGKYLDSPCPVFFGKEPVIAEDMGMDLQPVRVRCPSNGIAEPRIPAISEAAGQLRLRLRPQRWLSPMFHILFYVSVEGTDHLTRVQLHLNDRPGNRTLELFTEPGKETRLYLETWELSTQVEATVTELIASKTEFAVTYSMPTVTTSTGPGTTMTTSALGVASSSDWCRLKSAEGTFEIGHEFGKLRSNRAFAGIQIGSKTYFQEADETSGDPFFWDADHILQFGTTKVGDKVSGFVYRFGTSAQTSFVLHLPDRAPYYGP